MSYAPFEPVAGDRRAPPPQPAWSNVRGYGFIEFADGVQHPAMRLAHLEASEPRQRVHLNPSSLTPRHPPPDYMAVGCCSAMPRGGSHAHCQRLRGPQ